jgi:sugar fermentation stimulation protein A
VIDEISLDWGAPLRVARFVERPNRFVVHAALEREGAPEAPAAADPPREGIDPPRIESDPRPIEPDPAVAGERRVVAHLPDPGRLEELLVPGARMGLRPEPPSRTRKTRWTATLVEAPRGAGGGWVSVNTTMPNRLVRRALEASALGELEGWKLRRHEVPWRDSRLDFLLEDAEGGRLYVEAKSVTLVEDGVALFPDAVTARGARHLEELIDIVEKGHEAAVLFILQRPDASRIVAARAIDPVFGDTLARAEEAGVRVLGRRCTVTWEGIALGAPVPAGAG